jgi:outer membrane biosynthesis protein TonB
VGRSDKEYGSSGNTWPATPTLVLITPGLRKRCREIVSSSAPRKVKETAKVKLHMSRNQFYRSLVAVAATAAFWFVPALVSQATEITPIVVVGIPADSVALKHPTPEYPRVALQMHISGDVLLRVRVEQGVISEMKIVSDSSLLLAGSAQHWVRSQWNFKPSVSGVFTIPISYRESA